jgi:polyisoprenoid-binding protein YceI
MNKRKYLAGAMLALVVGVLPTMSATAQTPAAVGAVKGAPTAALKAGTYKIDPDHTHAYFVVSHLGITPFMGRFDDIQGTFVVGDKADKSSVKASIRVDSINTKQPKIEEHLRSPDFFDAAKFPTMEFQSTKVNWNAKGEGTMTGQLTIHGVTRPVDFHLKLTGVGVGFRGEVRAGFEAKTTIKRTDFGMKWGMPNVVGETVEITLAAEGVLQ